MATDIWGIDVSRYQGDIDWQKVKNAGVKFAIIQAGNSKSGSDEKDPYFEKHYAGATSVGIDVGAYYLIGAHVISKEKGLADAKSFLNHIQGKKFSYPVFIDVEKNDKSQKDGATAATIAFCEYMEAAGYYVGVYASAISGFKEKLNDDKLQDYVHWVADYSGKNRYSGTTHIWQYSSKYVMDGITVNTVDVNHCYVDFRRRSKLPG